MTIRHYCLPVPDMDISAMAGTAVGSVYGIKKSNNLIVYRMDQLEAKVDKHNNVVERMYKAEQCICLQEEQIKVANHRITDLRYYTKSKIDQLRIYSRTLETYEITNLYNGGSGC